MKFENKEILFMEVFCFLRYRTLRKLDLYILLTSAVVVLMRQSIQLVLFEGDMP